MLGSGAGEKKPIKEIEKLRAHKPKLERVVSNSTERKKAEEKLREGQENLVRAQRIAHLGSWERDFVKNEVNWSEELYRIFGVDPKGFEPTYEAFLNLVHPEDRQLVKEISTNAISGRQPFNATYRIVRPDGTERTVQSIGEVHADEMEQVTRIVGTIQDITERKKAEEEIKIFLSGIEDAYDGVAFTEMNGDVIYANEAAANIFGYSLAEMMKLNIAVFSAYSEEAKNLEEAVAKQGKWRGEITGIRKNKEKFPAILSVSIVKNGKGKPIGRMGIFRDITERKKAEEALRSSNRFLEIANRHTEMSSLLRDFVIEVQKLCSCAAVGIRILDEEGNIPYEDYVGFSQSFYESESPLSIKSDKCMCINVIKGDTDPTLPFYTKGGSFYMNGTTKFLSHVTEEEKGQTRNVCNEKGYESVALVPIYYRERILGLIHIADHKENMVPLDIIEILEGVGMQLGTAMRRIQTEEALRVSEEKYRELFENAGEGIITLDLDGRITEANRLIEEYGFNRAELLGRKLFEFVPEYDKARSVSDFEALIAGRRVQGQMDVITPKGIISVEYRDTPIVRAGEIIGVQAILTDITERKRGEERIEFLGRILETSPISVIATDEKAKIIYVNPATENLFGYETEELIGKDPSILNAEPDADKMQMRMLYTTRQKRVWKGELLNKKKNGERFYIQASCCQLLDEEGNFVALVGFQEDITERKRAEEALRESKEKFRKLAEKSPNMIFINKAGRIVYANQKSEEIMGYTQQEFCSPDFDFLSLISLEHTDLVRSSFNIHMTGEDVPPREYSLITKQGQRIETIVSTRLIQYDGQDAILGIVTDITERKRTEEAYRSLVDHSLQGLAIFQDGRIVFTNQVLADITGHTVEEMLAMTPEQVQAFVHPDDRELVWSQHRDRLNGEELPERYEFRGIRKDGSMCWVEIHASRIEYQGKPAIQAAYVDITERMKAEEELQKSERQASAAIEAARGFTFNYHIATGKINWGGAIEEITGYTPKEFSQVDADGWAERIHPDDRDRVLSILQEAIQVKDRATAEYRFRTKKGDYVILSSISLTEKKDGKAVRLLGILQDITERKKAEEALRESEEKFKSIFEHANDGVIYLDSSGNILDINEKAAQMFGGPKQQAVNKHFTEVGVFPADEIPMFMSNFEKIFAGEEVVLTVPIKNKKGQEIILECSASIAKTDDGAGRIMVIARDITERIKASEQIAKLAKFPAEDPNPVLRISGHGTVIYSNKASSTLLKTWICRVGESLPDHWNELVMDSLSSGQNHQTEVQCDGRIFSLTFAPVVDANYVNVYGHEITERKKAEDELRLYSEITVNMSEGVYAIRASDGIIVYTNPKFEQMFGYGPGELIGKNVSMVNAPTEKSPQETAKEIIDVLNKKGVWRGEILNIKKDGTPFWCYAGVSTFEHTEHEKLWVTMHTDITERKKAEEEIVNLAKFPEENASPVYRISKDGVLLYANSASRRLILEDITEIGNKIPEKWLGMIKNVYDSGKRQRVEVELSGRVFLFEQVPVIEGGYVNSYATDITERKKAEERLLEHQAKLKAMASKILMTEERERQRLAMGLHDEVCQKLVLTKLALESSLNLVSDSKLLASLRIACGGIGETIEQADSLTFELSNPVLRQLGLVIALEKYLTEEIRQKHGIEYELEGDEQLGTMQDEIKNCLFRVTRELLTNVVKHAHAHKIKVSVRESQSQIYVRVQDDGVGFKENQAGAKISQTARFGLFSIREQLEYLGGHLEIESEPGRGTTATVVVPLTKKAIV